MKYCILIFIAFLSCQDKNSEEPKIKTSSQQSSVLKSFETPQKNLIKFKAKDQIFFLQWIKDNKLETLNHEFDLNSAEASWPRFVAENEDYMLFRAGCGNPCWNGFFIPLHGSKNETVINEYLAFDLNQNYVAYINSKTNNLEVLNIKNSKRQELVTDKCDSAFKGYCIDTIYFGKKELIYSWIPETITDSKKRHLIRSKINI